MNFNFWKQSTIYDKEKCALLSWTLFQTKTWQLYSRNGFISQVFEWEFKSHTCWQWNHSTPTLVASHTIHSFLIWHSWQPQFTWTKLTKWILKCTNRHPICFWLFFSLVREAELMCTAVNYFSGLVCRTQPDSRKCISTTKHPDTCCETEQRS